MTESLDRAVRAMQKNALFEGVGARPLFALLEGAEPQSFAAGEAVFEPGDAADALYVLVEGRLAVVSPAGRRERGAPWCFGAVELVEDRPRVASVRALAPSRVLRIGWQRVAQQLRRSPALRGAIRSGPGDLRVEAALADVTGERMVVLAPTRRQEAALAEHLAAAIAEDFGERVVRLVVTPDQVGLGKPAPGVVTTCRLGADPAALQTKAFARLEREFDVLFLDLSQAEAPARAAFLEAAHKVLNVSVGAPPADSRVGGEAAFFDTVIIPPGGWARPSPALPPGVCRLRLDLARVESGRPLIAEDRAGFARWARAVTDRTVGVALGGGGAWGFAHVAVLRALDGRVPIDFISGASFGTVAGAFYALQGAEGLTRLVALGRSMRRAVLGSVLTSGLLARFIRRHLGDHALEDLIPVLLPMATDVASGAPEVIRGTSLAEAVRASSAFPGALTPATWAGPDGRDRRFVDGGFANNVPDAVLALEGADLVASVSVVPPPRVRAARSPTVGGALGRWAHEFNPVSRMVDAYRAAFILMHAADRAESSLADVTYVSRPVAYLPLDFDQAEAIVRDAAPLAEGFADQVVARWAALRRPRRPGA